VLQLFVALGEELSFRNYLYEELQKATGNKTVAAIVSSAGFTALHLPSMFLLDIPALPAVMGLTTIFIASLVMTLLYERYGILAAVGFHFFWNFLQYHVFGLGLGHALPSALNTEFAGDVLLTGGAFGPEASLPGLLVIVVFLAIFWYVYRKQNAQVAKERQEEDSKAPRRI
jgi:hypothetical protein